MTEISVAIVGYGRMGREVEQAARARNIPISHIITDRQKLESAKFSATDIAVCFTNPRAEAENVRYLCSRGVSMVIGTTGWQHQVPELEHIVRDNKVGLLVSGNFSLGVQLFQKMVRMAAETLAKTKVYDVLMHEWHHQHKQDAPSGTAKELAHNILDVWPDKKEWVLTPHDRAVAPHELAISAARGGAAFGEHQVIFDSEADCITLTHTSKGRAAYAHGALSAAQWLAGKKGLYTLDEMMSEWLS
ncbi:MAG: 4-hydroxy-tetrahydrodipicolinate reductase [Alphaproteobacteria bacterium]|nr:4-hydroxy-tetrahydrodipicolinate reductase [Alphaproteobacteria bacterium]NDC55769.1 4-hydroxy-tetrahydrodipicolinate reductase [Alphaproteobacteria bacterium]NDG04079.1 4-hydroxy-tetrahydrodipicolinate reductase [Alphaproteobacteria bacterium]